jgi:hypothetical protein
MPPHVIRSPLRPLIRRRRRHAGHVRSLQIVLPNVTTVKVMLGAVAQMATAMDTPMAHSGITTASNAGGQGIRWIRRLVLMNLGLVALQALSAGFFMSGYGHAVTIDANVGHVLQLGALTQGVAAVVLWRRRRVPARSPATASVCS